MNMVVDPAMLHASMLDTSGPGKMPVTSHSGMSSYHGRQLGAHIHARLKVSAATKAEGFRRDRTRRGDE